MGLAVALGTEGGSSHAGIEREAVAIRSVAMMVERYEWLVAILGMRGALQGLLRIRS